MTDQLFLLTDEDIQKYRDLLRERCEYTGAYLELHDLIDKLRIAFLGPDWYIEDPVRNIQADEIIVNEVIRRFAPKPKFKIKHKWKNFCKRGVKRDESTE